jgi:seryl-tRNA synthetase
MIDIKHLVSKSEIYRRELEIRNMDRTLIEKCIFGYEKLNLTKQKLDILREQKNNFNNIVVNLPNDEKPAAIAEMKAVSENIKQQEEIKNTQESELQSLIYKIPNLTWSGIPVADDESGNIVTNVYGDKPIFDGFEPKHYYELPVFLRDYKGKEGVEAAGTRGYYITGKLALLQRALFRYVEDRVVESGFEYVIPPVMVNEEVMYGTGFFPSSKNDFYTVNPQEDNLFLVGSSEPSLMFLYNGRKLDLDEPKLLAANTTCFRREAGTYGKDTKGGIRVHQFEKIETVVICKPEDSDKMFDYITGFFTETMTSLGLHGHHLEACTGDMSLKNHRMIDIEAWFPAQGKYRELCSSSNCTDYQTRNLNIKYQKDNGEYELAHSLNCTGVTNRTMFAILEQFQQADGSVIIPEVLVKYCGLKSIT